MQGVLRGGATLLLLAFCLAAVGFQQWVRVSIFPPASPHVRPSIRPPLALLLHGLCDCIHDQPRCLGRIGVHATWKLKRWANPRLFTFRQDIMNPAAAFQSRVMGFHSPIPELGEEGEEEEQEKQPLLAWKLMRDCRE
jgi:hypothetical protein